MSKFAAASRIACAVINGWPEPPSSPLQGSGADEVAEGEGAAPGCGAGALALPGEIEPVKILSNRLNGDCASAAPDPSATPHSAAAITHPVFAVPTIITVLTCFDYAALQQASPWFPSA